MRAGEGLGLHRTRGMVRGRIERPCRHGVRRLKAQKVISEEVDQRA